jgi:hypothetical protein
VEPRSNAEVPLDRHGIMGGDHAPRQGDVGQVLAVGIEPGVRQV